MKDGYWEGVPAEYTERWRRIFDNNKEGPDISICCPICHNKGLHRYYQTGKRMKSPADSEQYSVRGSEWQWCSYCRTFEHAEVKVPDWWIPSLEIDGNKLTAIPEILDIAYQDEKIVNKWSSVTEQYIESWNKIFSENQEKAVLNESCPICGKKMLRQYYTLDTSEHVKYKKKMYKGQGAHWEWCAACFHYKFNHRTYVPLNWVCEISIEPWKLMTIPEPINEKM